MIYFIAENIKRGVNLIPVVSLLFIIPVFSLIFRGDLILRSYKFCFSRGDLISRLCKFWVFRGDLISRKLPKSANPAKINPRKVESTK